MLDIATVPQTVQDAITAAIAAKADADAAHSAAASKSQVLTDAREKLKAAIDQSFQVGAA